MFKFVWPGSVIFGLVFVSRDFEVRWWCSIVNWVRCSWLQACTSLIVGSC